jgi:hypothetical protein
MLNTAQRFLTNAPWMDVWPGLAIFLHARWTFRYRTCRWARTVLPSHRPAEGDERSMQTAGGKTKLQ